jgi:BirA family transcriptional regulator, biotin operon repressor / biotin---[acetyl-CoA-carboxylase] ligase
MSPASAPLPLGLPRLHLRCTDSTNERARLLALAGAPHGTLVTAGEQRAGRGRQGRTWSAPGGRALLCSILLREVSTLLPLLGGVAVAEATDSQLKWPNDVVRQEGGRLRKVAGILTEGRPQERWAVLGIGINVAVRPEDLPDELRETAGTLGGEPEDIEPLLAHLLRTLEQWSVRPDAELLDAWRARDALRGRRVSWTDGRGIATGIDGEGRLVVTLADGGRRTLHAGEVHLASVGDV